MKISRKVSFFLFLFLVMSTIITTITTAYDPTKYRPIHINNIGGSEQTYYQVLLNVSYDSDMQTDFDDLRVKYYDGDEWVFIPYWIEDKVDGEWCKLWFNATYIPANSWFNDSYRLYYGDNLANSESNGTTTFQFFDDFEGTSLDTEKWSEQSVSTSVSDSILHAYPTANYGGLRSVDPVDLSDWRMLETKIKMSTDSDQQNGVGFFDRTDATSWYQHPSVFIRQYAQGVNDIKCYLEIEGDHYVETLKDGIDENWHRYKIKAKESAHPSYWFDSDTLTISHNVEADTYYIWVPKAYTTHSTDEWTECDWIFVRKCTEPNPSAQLGEKQSVCTSPTISSLTNSTPGTTSVTITWTTDQSTDNHVKYSKNSDLSDYSWSSWDNDTTSVSITLTGLDPNTTYYYQAWSYNDTDIFCYTTEPSSQPYKNFTTLDLSGIEPLYINIEEVGEGYVKINASWIGFDAFETGYYFVFCNMSYGNVKSKKTNGDGKLTVEETLYGLFVEGKEYCCKAAAYRGNSSADSVYTDEVCFIATSNKTLKQTNYGGYMNDLTDISTELNVTLWASILSEPYKERMGLSFFGILFILPFIAMWIRGSNTIIPSILGMILGGFIWAYMPEKFVHMAYLFIIISIAGVIYGIFRQKV